MAWDIAKEQDLDPIVIPVQVKSEMSLGFKNALCLFWQVQNYIEWRTGPEEIISGAKYLFSIKCLLSFN